MKDLGTLSYFLRLEVTSSSDGYYLSQAKYASDLLSKAGITDNKTVSTPLEYNAKLTPLDGEPISDATRYRQLVGSLIYLTVTHPDISHAVGMVSKFMDAPRSIHYAAVLWILRYVKGTLYHGLHYSSRSSLELHAYSDANWAGDPTDRCSIIGFCFLLGTSLVSWHSKKQNVVSHSSTEVEYRALATPLVNLFGFAGSWLTWMLHSPLPLLFIMTIVVLSALLIMMSSTNAPSILRSTAKSLTSILRKEIPSYSPSPPLTNLLISLPRLTRLVVFEILYPNSSWLPSCHLEFE